MTLETPTTELSPDERQTLLEFYWAKPHLFMADILADWFPTAMPWVHRGIMALVLESADFLTDFGTETWQQGESTWTPADLRKIEKHFTYRGTRLFQIKWDGDKVLSIRMITSHKTLAVLPRGFSKTTLFKALLILCILYEVFRFIVYISEASPHAQAQMNDIRRELQSNERLRALYGNLVPERNDPQKWTDEEFETLTGTYVVARGRGGQVRGLNRDSQRPDCILFDDLEDLESVSTEEQRKKCRMWFRSDVERAKRLVGRKTKFFGLGTVLDKEALLMVLKDDPDWLSMTFGAVDNDGDALWSVAMSLEQIEAEKKSYAATGDLASFYREVLSTLRTTEDSKFKESFIRHVARDKDEFVARALACDPAISEGITASHCVFAVVGIDDKGRIHVLDIYGKRGMTPRQQVDMYFELVGRWDTTHHGIESISYQKALVHLMQEEMFRKGKTMGPRAYFEITPITHSEKASRGKTKGQRILGVLQPRYSAGYVTHQRSFPDLETALLEWPNGQNDYPDAVAMAITLLDPYAALAGDSEAEPTDAELESVEDEIGYDFRRAP